MFRPQAALKLGERVVRSLTGNIENRVRKLPKPSNATQGLQPLFEAVSNSFYAIEDRFEDDATKGVVAITVSNLADPTRTEIVVRDNGIGLDEVRYDAFCEVDTDFKRKRGGKGVGRLFWLDAFSSIQVESGYFENDLYKKRSFEFILSNSNQVIPLNGHVFELGNEEVGTRIRFLGLRSQDYSHCFPKRADTFLRYFSAHFIADFLVGNGPKVNIVIGGELTSYPDEVTKLVVSGPLEAEASSRDEYGQLQIIGFICKSEASTGLEGNHQLHLLANGRTVETRKIDNLLGIKNISRSGQAGLVFHGCVSGKYLDDRVNEGRTAFNIPESGLDAISRYCVDVIKEKLLADDVEAFSKDRRKSYETFVSRHPIYGFDDPDVQLKRVPFYATEAEDFAAGLVKYQIRREEDRQKALQSIIDLIEQGKEVPQNFTDVIERAAKGIQESERLALAQHVTRRKLVLEILDRLIKRFRSHPNKDDDYYLEKTLHSFIVPMHIRGDDPEEVKSRAHDLWVIDERLAFTRAFSSDKRLDQILKTGGSDKRPDLLLWDYAIGMGVTDPTSAPDHVDVTKPITQMMVVEFKRPMRRDYSGPEDNIEFQITKYLLQLLNGHIESFGRENIRVADDCIFHCYVIADIVGDLADQLSGWPTTSNGQGRIRQLQNKFRGSIEVIQWQDLINDAWARNSATLLAAGLKRSVPHM